MAANEPTAKNLAGLYKLGSVDWDDVRGTLENNLTPSRPRTRTP